MGKPEPSDQSEIKDSTIINISEIDNWPQNAVIFKVPKMLRDLDEDAYTPQLVSIGPFHHGEVSLKGMQSHKENHYFKAFLKRTEKSEGDIKGFIGEEFNSMIKHKYAGAIEIGFPKFVKIILYDACFIFELFLLYCEEQREEDFILRTPLFYNRILMDLIMLENQIPFSFLKKLYEFCEIKLPEECEFTTFLEFSTNFFDLTTPLNFDENGIKHFTDLYRRCMLPKYDSKKISDTATSPPNNAKKLDKAGVDFAAAPENDIPPQVKVEVFPEEGWCEYIPFIGSLKLQLPIFTIMDSTEHIMRNIIAMEQCQPDQKRVTPFCNYISLMDNLIDTEEDIDLLVAKGVIINHTGSNEAASKMINRLCQNMSIATNIYNEEYDKLNRFSERWYNRAKATLKRVYFKDIWTTSSTVVGFFVLIFTIISTIESIWSFHHESRSTNKSILSFVS